MPRFGALMALLVVCFAPAAMAAPAPIVFDLENQVPTPTATEEGRLSFLSLSHNDLSLEITRPGSVFDVIPNNTSNYYTKPAAWGAVSLSTFFDPYNSAPLNINFSIPVSGFSILMGDFAQDTDALELEAFSLPDGQGESLGRTTRTLTNKKDDHFGFEELAVHANGIRSVRILAGSAVAAHSMFYDRLTVETSPSSGS